VWLSRSASFNSAFNSRTYPCEILRTCKVRDLRNFTIGTASFARAREELESIQIVRDRIDGGFVT
jgi:hypothetical protein